MQGSCVDATRDPVVVGNLEPREIATRVRPHFQDMARVVLSLLLLLGVAAGFQAAPLLRPASQAAVSRCAADSIQVRAALFSKHGGSLEGSLERTPAYALPSGGAGAVGSVLCT